MSAYVVSAATIDLILSVAEDRDVVAALRRAYPHKEFGQIESSTDGDEARGMLGRYLLSVNTRAVMYRYPNEPLEAMPGAAQYESWREGMEYHPMPEYAFTRMRVPSDGPGWRMTDDAARRVLGAVHCFDYQSCELPEYECTSAAWLMRRVAREAAGVVAAGWEVSDHASAWSVSV